MPTSSVQKRSLHMKRKGIRATWFAGCVLGRPGFYCAGKFPVASDADDKITKSYNLMANSAKPGMKDVRGEEIGHDFIERVTFVISKDHKISSPQCRRRRTRSRPINTWRRRWRSCRSSNSTTPFRGQRDGKSLALASPPARFRARGVPSITWPEIRERRTSTEKSFEPVL